MTHDIDFAIGEPARPDGIRIFPCEGEYPVYTADTYDIMNEDEFCEKAYLDAIRDLVAGKTVLDIGTGRDAAWAIEAIRAGARHVYAVEVLPHWAEVAGTTVAQAGMSDVITVHNCCSMDVVLPEPVDVCVSEIIGSIGGAEGAAAAIHDARIRLMANASTSIPDRCTTAIAAISLDHDYPEGILLDTGGIETFQDIFTAVGHPFDVRLCLEGPVAETVVSTIAEVEDLRFNQDLVLAGTDRATLRVTHDRPRWPRGGRRR